jgi:hypothetical protein
VVDLLALTAHEEGERPADTSLDRDAERFLVVDPGAEHPTSDDRRIEPGVEDPFRPISRSAGWHGR